MGSEAYIEKFERVVDLLRNTGSYTLTSISATEYEVTSDVITYVKVDDYITLAGLKVRVISIVSDKVFQVVDTLSQTLATDGTWKALAPYSMYGTRKTINEKLLRKNGGEFSYQKYPLIALRLPNRVDVTGAVASVSMNVLIAHWTNKSYQPEERLAYKFEPILWPLTRMFIEGVRASGEFAGFEPNYSTIDRLFYGTGGGDENIANVFDDPLDAVEIRDLKVNYFADCSPLPAAIDGGGFQYILNNVFES